PNPFNPTTTIAFHLPHVSRITLHVFDVTGRRVRTLVNGKLPAGAHRVVWDGTDDGGRAVAGGVYFYRLQAGDFVATRKMLLIK
ncbi:MAG: T9SS C-terminal target domain-containing protein, partial [Calditrichaeota bacterium]